MELAIMAIAGGAGLFSYNRKNFMFDKKLRQAREFQHQSLRVEQFVLYREDVRDLVELTCQKMDIYLVMSALLGEKTIVMVCFQNKALQTDIQTGEDEKIDAPQWMWNLNALALACGVCYLLLTFWLAMYASVSAQAFGVRLLTQYVRLPIADDAELDSATNKATDFEGTTLTQLLRVPILQRRGAGTRDSPEERAAANARARAASEQSSLGGEDRQDATQLVPAAMLEHIRLYRRVQLNWQAYDAYARVSLFAGASCLLYACLFWTLGQFYVNEAVACIGATCVFAVVQLVLARLDLRLSHFQIFIIGTILLVTPMFAAVGLMFAAKRNETKLEWKTEYTVQLCGLLAHGLHTVVVFFILVASWPDPQTGADDEALLPGKFRSTLYLDVFGWLLNARSGNDGEESSSFAANRVSLMRLWHGFSVRRTNTTEMSDGLAADTRRVMAVPTSAYGGPEATPAATIEAASVPTAGTAAGFTPDARPIAVSAKTTLPGETPWRAFTYTTLTTLFVWLMSTGWMILECIHVGSKSELSGSMMPVVHGLSIHGDGHGDIFRAACAAGGLGPVMLRHVHSNLAVAELAGAPWYGNSTDVMDATCGLKEHFVDVAVSCASHLPSDLDCVAALLQQGGRSLRLCRLQPHGHVKEAMELTFLQEAQLSLGTPALRTIAVALEKGGGTASTLRIFGRATSGALLVLHTDDDGELVPAFDLERASGMLNNSLSVDDDLSNVDERLFFANGTLLSVASVPWVSTTNQADTCHASYCKSDVIDLSIVENGGKLEFRAWNMISSEYSVRRVPGAAAWIAGATPRDAFAFAGVCGMNDAYENDASKEWTSTEM